LQETGGILAAGTPPVNGRKSMRGWTKGLLLAALVCAAAGACARAGDIVAPDGADVRMDESAPPPADGAVQSDSSDGRWGGFIGSGG
jgi:hypothetical protein